MFLDKASSRREIIWVFIPSVSSSGASQHYSFNFAMPTSEPSVSGLCVLAETHRLHNILNIHLFHFRLDFSP